MDAARNNTISNRVVESAKYAVDIEADLELLEMLQDRPGFPGSVTKWARQASVAENATVVSVDLLS